MSEKQWAEYLENARVARTPVAPITETVADFSLEQAYRVQRTGRRMRLEKGETLRGYKMGLTSTAKQRDVQVFEPIRGYLSSAMELAPGEPVDTSVRIHPRVEPEVAVILGKPLEGRVDLARVIAACERVVPAFEILDSRFQGFQFRLPDVVADNTSASGFALGSGNLLDRLSDLRLMGVVVRKNGVVEQTGAPAAVLGEPLRAVVALVRALAAEGERLEAGSVVLTGGITAAVPFAAGDVLEIIWPGETLAFRAE